MVSPISNFFNEYLLWFLFQLANWEKNIFCTNNTSLFSFSTSLKFLISVTFLILFWDFSDLHGLIRTYTFIYFWEKFPPTYTVYSVINIKKFPSIRPYYKTHTFLKKHPTYMVIRTPRLLGSPECSNWQKFMEKYSWNKLVKTCDEFVNRFNKFLSLFHTFKVCLSRAWSSN